MKLHMLAPLQDEDDGHFRSSRSKFNKPAHRDLRPARGILKKNDSGDTDETDRSSVLISAFVAGAAAGYLLWRMADNQQKHGAAARETGHGQTEADAHARRNLLLPQRRRPWYRVGFPSVLQGDGGGDLLET
ncbi:hypothetical protein MGG_13346 [Pyricularia oryzae 70-15]|uniref:Uncharacterized protein n=1 Tax=Pyricularia oryzae (strain 70-15 / ATCC MYA-4617 / FGSC 8958) TaxID=242507 RepID=G4MZW9_PYRO7|nr:uncharacterized protein MGG_13346 [Pyricularia oryzae 70-15]EHA51413.1 hypothetical protein MGG_13346 [Pyricularia oryzae 70-15]